jgi:predicted  nucleic acid-binding Zn-ribbon protein
MLSGCPECGGNKFQFEPSGSSGGSSSAGGSASAGADTGESDADSSSDTGGSGAVSQATQTVRDWVGRDGLSDSDDGTPSTDTSDWPDHGTDSKPDTDPQSDAPSEQSAGAASGRNATSAADRTAEQSSGSGVNATPSSEDAAQASARSDVVDPDELPESKSASTDHPFDDSSSNAPEVDGEVVDTPDQDQPDLEALRQELNEQFESIKIVRPGEYELNLMELYDRDEYIISLMEDGRYAIEVPDAWRNGE